MSYKEMCSDTELARLNRARIKAGETNGYYNAQKRAIDQWKLGEPAPKEVALGDLPMVGKHRIEQREED